MSAMEGFLNRQVVNTYHSSTSGRTLILGKDTHDVYTLIQAVCVVIATSNRVLATPFTLITAHPHSQTHTTHTHTPHTHQTGVAAAAYTDVS